MPSRFFPLPNSPNFVFCSFARQFSPILCAAFLFVGWCDWAVYAQSDARNQQNRNTRNTRLSQTENPDNPAVMMREMQAALQKLPWNELSAASQAKIKSVVSGSPLFHRMPQQKVYADPEIYQFLLQHPDMVIGFWEQLGATQLSLRETKANHFILRETGGTVAAVEILHQTNNLCIVYAKGEYRGPLLAKAYQGDVILVMRTQHTRDEGNEPVIICDLDTFIQINSLGADMLVKLFFASLAKVADSNFEVTVAFVSQVSRAASRTPNTVKEATEEITSVQQEVCTEFCEVVDRVAMRFARRNQPTQHQPALPQTARLQPVPTQPKASPQALTLSSRPPADWGMDHFFDSPQPALFEPIHHRNTGELTIPKIIEPERSGNAVPKLPRPEW